MTSNRSKFKSPFYKKLLSQKMPLTLGLSPSGTHLSRLDMQEQQSVLLNHKEARSQFEQSTILEIYENRIGASPTAWFGYVLIGLVIASGAAFVPLGVSLDVANPMLKVSWRVTGLLPFLGILGFIQAYKTKMATQNDFDPISSVLDKKNLINLVVAAFAISLQQYCAIFAGKYTLMSHSVIFVNLSGPVIVAWRLIQ